MNNSQFNYLQGDYSKLISDGKNIRLGGGAMTTNGDFWGLMGTKNHGD